MKFIALFPAIAVMVLCLFNGAYAAKKEASADAPRGRKIVIDPAARDRYFARASGNWDSNIWSVWRANKDERELGYPVPGLRPAADTSAEINGPNVTVTLTTPVTLNSFRIMRDNGALVIDKGGSLTLEKEYFGQGGAGTAGGITLNRGGKMTVNGPFYLAGILLDCTGTGSFMQNGGELTINGTLYLTGAKPLSSSAQATGVFQLNTGTLSIRPPVIQAGLRNGLGHGNFSFKGGTLDTLYCDLDIENTQKGNFSPGGDEAVGQTQLVSEADRTFLQGKGARFTLNIAGAKKHDVLIWKGKSSGSRVVFEDGAGLDIRLLNAYRPVSGATFTVIEADLIETKGALKLDGPDGNRFAYKIEKNGRGMSLELRYR